MLVCVLRCGKCASVTEDDNIRCLNRLSAPDAQMLAIQTNVKDQLLQMAFKKQSAGRQPHAFQKLGEIESFVL